MAKSVKFSDMGIVEPEARLKHLASFGNYIKIDSNIPAIRYYRSGMEMEHMAKVYLSEGNLEDAYILYIKFTTLFLEKIIEHPEYKKVPMAMKQQNKVKLKEILDVLEQLKMRLLERYKKEYVTFLANKEAEKARALKLQKEKEENDRKAAAASTPGVVSPISNAGTDYTHIPSAPDISLLNDIVYPNDFPSDPNRTSSGGLILPDSDPKRPTFDRNLKPSSALTREDGLRLVVIPKDTMFRFLYLVNENTAKNVETCGILAGRLAHNQLILSHIIIPKQRGTSDSCLTMNEEEIFDVQDQFNLITLGWIHTHPSQTAFLSSVDLHTHCSYQMMMPEALAIVCAPKYQKNGFFCLTPNYGLDYIAQCRLEGFHPHPTEPSLFMEADHYKLDDVAKIEVVDRLKNTRHPRDLVFIALSFRPSCLNKTLIKVIIRAVNNDP